MSPEEFEQQHKALHLIGMTVRQGRPSTVVCPACEARKEQERPRVCENCRVTHSDPSRCPWVV